MNTFSTATATFLLAISLNAESAKHDHDDHDHSRQHEAHVHGHAELTLAQEGKEIEVTLRSPSANIVGFEHKASTDKQIHQVEDAKEILMSGSKNFIFSGTDCELEHTKVDVSALLGEHEEDHDHKHEKDDHAHNEKHDDHDHDKDHDEEHEETHSDVTALYHFECKNMQDLASIRVNLFDHFPGIEELNTQWVTDTVQGGAELTKGKRVIKLK